MKKRLHRKPSIFFGIKFLSSWRKIIDKKKFHHKFIPFVQRRRILLKIPHHTHFWTKLNTQVLYSLCKLYLMIDTRSDKMIRDNFICFVLATKFVFYMHSLGAIPTKLRRFMSIIWTRRMQIFRFHREQHVQYSWNHPKTIRGTCYYCNTRIQKHDLIVHQCVYEYDDRNTRAASKFLQ